MPAPRPTRPGSSRISAKPPAAPAEAPPPPAPGTVKPSTRVSAVRPAAAARPPAPPPPPVPARPGTAAVPRPGTAAAARPGPAAPRPATAAVPRPPSPAAAPGKEETEIAPVPAGRGSAVRPATSRAAQAPPRPGPRAPRAARGQADEDEDEAADGGVRRGGLGKRQLMWIAVGGGGLAIALIVLAMAWGPMQRGRQLAAIEANAAPERIETARRLAQAFAQEHGPRSQHVVDAITSNRVPVEARIEMCRAGQHLRLLAAMLQDDSLQPAQRGLICAALSEMWPADGTGPAVTDSINSWAIGPEAPPELADHALRLVVARAASDAPELLARGASDARIQPDRALRIALGLGRVIERQANGAKWLLVAFAGAHRAALLSSVQLQDAVRAQAMNDDIEVLFPMLDQADSRLAALAGLGGRRVQLADRDAALRASLVEKLKPLLAAGSADPVLAGALQAVRRQRLVECRAEVLALLPRLARQRPEQLPPDDLAELLGRALVHTQTPAAAAAAEEMVAGLSDALDRDATRTLAAVALSKVQEPGLDALRLALDELAAQGGDTCLAAVDTLVGGVYARKDLVKAAEKRGWPGLLADDRRRRARYEAIRLWLKEHGEETTVRSDKAVLSANKEQLGRMRDEIRAWQESADPPPIGLTKARLDELQNQVQLMLNMVLKASSGV